MLHLWALFLRKNELSLDWTQLIGWDTYHLYGASKAILNLSNPQVKANWFFLALAIPWEINDLPFDLIHSISECIWSTAQYIPLEYESTQFHVSQQKEIQFFATYNHFDKNEF